MPSAGSFLATAICFGSTLGHMIMQHPIPFGKETLNNSPLVDAKPGTSQSDYPCKQRPGVYKVDTVNKMSVGSPIELNFTGSASHGGGTCQISVTLDKEPSVKSVFKVIQTYEGGCPTAQDGNSGSTDFSFKIPKGFPNGRMSLAWTWYNKIGNRELYMNCAPIEVSGGSDNNDVYDALPNMYLINMPTSECKSADSMDVQVPDPGQYNLKAATAKLAPPTGPGCAAAAKAVTAGTKSNSAGSSAGSSSAPSASSDSNKAPASSSSEGQATSAPASSGMTTVTTKPASSAPSSESTFPTMTISSNAGVSGPASTGFAAAPPSGTGSASSGTSSGSCSSNGGIVCNGTSKFGLCNNGKVIWQSVASGTQCVNGQIQKRSDSRHAHIRRHVAKGF